MLNLAASAKATITEPSLSPRPSRSHPGSGNFPPLLAQRYFLALSRSFAEAAAAPAPLGAAPHLPTRGPCVSQRGDTGGAGVREGMLGALSPQR